MTVVLFAVIIIPRMVEAGKVLFGWENCVSEHFRLPGVSTGAPQPTTGFIAGGDSFPGRGRVILSGNSPHFRKRISRISAAMKTATWPSTWHRVHVKESERMILKRVLRFPAFALIITVLGLGGIWLAHRPTTDKYVTGTVLGPVSLILDSKIHFITYSSDGYRLREGDVNLYLINYFTISLKANETRILLYLSQFTNPSSMTWDQESWFAPYNSIRTVKSRGRTDLGDYFISSSVVLLRPTEYETGKRDQIVFEWKKKPYAELYEGDIVDSTGKHVLSFVCSADITSLSMSRILGSPGPPKTYRSPLRRGSVVHGSNGTLTPGLYKVQIVAFRFDRRARKYFQLTIGGNTRRKFLLLE